MVVIQENINIFDFDDTLFDTTPSLYRAYHYAIRETTGIELPLGVFTKFKGCNFEKFCNFIGIHDLEDLERIHRIKYDIYPVNYIEHLKMNQVFERFSRFCHNVICSNTESGTINQIANHYTILDTFDDIYTPDITGCYKNSIVFYEKMFKKYGNCVYTMYDDCNENFDIFDTDTFNIIEREFSDEYNCWILRFHYR